MTYAPAGAPPPAFKELLMLKKSGYARALRLQGDGCARQVKRSVQIRDQRLLVVQLQRRLFTQI